ncbi:mechanosensitive ion channel family protein [Sedimentitalea nanhaiensis]|uniref:Small-conductance mechanosensitive channel n=1 Tax=Sedimentitalea nanhaiensis TaxID=999627 RepID=A0A1I7BBA6_9RHOB|nr:mechanosensitive ion channel family protein [Sedimentitalea nanhaiensis]SFT84332.1 Small-conductance mechanosensitive channel [Sedimentitalea nanhaiensis]
MAFFSRISRISGVVSLLLLGLCGPAAAQMGLAASSSQSEPTVTELPDPLTQDAVREMVARMSDDQVRGMLLDRLDAVAAAESSTRPENVSFFGRLKIIWTALYSNPLDAIVKLPTLITKEARVIADFTASVGGAVKLLALFGLIGIVLIVAYGVEVIAERLTRNWRKQTDPTEAGSLKESVQFLFRRFMREIFGLMVFYFTARTVGRLLLSPEQLAFAAPLVTYLVWWPRLAGAVSRFVLAPKQPAMRLVNVSDQWARFLHRHMVGLILLAGLTLFAVGFNMANGADLAETRLAFWLDSSIYLYIVFIAWSAREGLTDMMLGTDPDRTEFDECFARFYPYFAMGVAAVMWVIVTILAGLGKTDQLLKGAHYVTMFWLLMLPLLDTVIRGLVRHLVPPMIGEGPLAETAYRSTKRSYIRIGRVLMAGLVLILIAQSWDITINDFLSARQGIGTNLIEFLITLAVGYVVYEIVSLWINRQLAKEQTSAAPLEQESAADGGGAGGSRLATVLPLLRVTAQIAIAVIFSLLAIGALGIDITPLLAGAGILGLAIGFGAQKLVADVVSGIFFLVDDAFRVGEYVEVDGTMGTVEKISIRSMQLRHHLGLVHTLPYGEIPKITNFSRDWVIMKLKFTVPFDVDPEKVRKIFKRIGQDLWADERFKGDFLEPFKSQGVSGIDDVGITIRGKFMARPGTQFMIRKEIYNRVQDAFAENGIEFARREVRVAIPGLEHAEDLTDDEKSAIGAAATGVVQAQIEKEKGAG